METKDYTKGKPNSFLLDSMNKVTLWNFYKNAWAHPFPVYS